MSNSYDFDVIELYTPNNPMGAIEASPSLMASGWVGGLWVKYVTSQSSKDGSAIRIKRTVGAASPANSIGFLLRGSYEETDQYTGRWPGKTGNVAVCVAGQFLLKYFETKNLAERTIPGSGALLSYTLNESLYVSSNGLLTSEMEVIGARTVGMCSGVPDDNNGYLGCDMYIGVL